MLIIELFYIAKYYTEHHLAVATVTVNLKTSHIASYYKNNISGRSLTLEVLI